MMHNGDGDSEDVDRSRSTWWSTLGSVIWGEVVLWISYNVLELVFSRRAMEVVSVVIVGAAPLLAVIIILLSKRE
jgi:membrane protein DedA with SNARE-associated domain